VHLNAVDDAADLTELPLLLTIRRAAKVLDVCPAKATRSLIATRRPGARDCR
jgi:hypothetical protein